MKDKKYIEKLSFEEAAKQLESIVTQLEAGNVELEKAIDLYSSGSLLKEHCQKKLEEAKLKVDKIIEREGKEITIEQDRDFE